MHVIYCYVIRRVLCRYFDFTVRDILFVAPANVYTRFHKLRFRQMQKHNDCISNLRLNMETKSQETLWVRQMHLDVYRRAVEWKESGKGYYSLDPLASKRNPFDLHLSPKCKKGCLRIQMFLESARNGCSSGRKIGYIASFRAVPRHYFRS